jgi:putative ABC transport system permease protein
MPLHDTFTRDQKPMLFAITLAAGFVLLIAGANVASLLLSKYLESENQTGIRAALGAPRWRLVREFLGQSLLLAVIGSVAGVLLAMWLTNPLFALSPMASDSTGSAMREFDTSVGLDGPVLLASVGLTLLVGLGFGLLPALRGSRGDLQLALKGGSRSSTLDRGTRRLLGALVVTEIAVAVVLLVATGLTIKSFRNLVTEPWGFATDNRLSFSVSFSARLRPEHADRVAYIDQALERLRAMPGVISATATTPDLVSFGRNLAAITPQDTTPPEPRGYFLVNHRMAVPGYFRDAGIRIVRGRAFDETDRLDGQKVAVISESFAKRFWPGQDPIGKTIKRGRANDQRPPFLVIGVFADVKGEIDSVDGDVPGLWYLPYAQNPTYLANDIVFVVHSQQPAETLQPLIRAELAKVDGAIAPYGFDTLERLVDDTYVQGRFALLLISLFGGLGLLLSAIGLYGLLAFQVTRRTREIGVRTALGAGSGDIVRLVLREGGWLLALGLVAGGIAAFAVTRLLQSQLHGVTAGDPVVYVLTAAVLALVTLLACFIPARRAAKIDPLVALRTD